MYIFSCFTPFVAALVQSHRVLGHWAHQAHQQYTTLRLRHGLYHTRRRRPLPFKLFPVSNDAGNRCFTVSQSSTSTVVSRSTATVDETEHPAHSWCTLKYCSCSTYLFPAFLLTYPFRSLELNILDLLLRSGLYKIWFYKIYYMPSN